MKMYNYFIYKHVIWRKTGWHFEIYCTEKIIFILCKTKYEINKYYIIPVKLYKTANTFCRFSISNDRWLFDWRFLYLEKLLSTSVDVIGTYIWYIILSRYLSILPAVRPLIHRNIHHSLDSTVFFSNTFLNFYWMTILTSFDTFSIFLVCIIAV